MVTPRRWAALVTMPSIAGAHSLLTEPLLDASSRPTATHWGIIRAYVEAGRLARVVPFEKDAFAPSPVIQAFMDRVYSETRVRYPMVRRDFLKNGAKSDRTERGRGDFVRVSWDDALNHVSGPLPMDQDRLQPECREFRPRTAEISQDALSSRQRDTSGRASIHERRPGRQKRHE